LTKGASRAKRLVPLLGRGVLFLLASSSALFILFIFYFIIRDAVPFFQLQGFKDFFTGVAWYPSADPPSFGALPMFFGTGLVTLGAVVVSVPLGVAAAVCMSDILPFRARQIFKPITEVLAAIPSVAFGFFALVVFAPLLQQNGGVILSVFVWIAGLPVLALVVFIVSDSLAARFHGSSRRRVVRLTTIAVLGGIGLWAMMRLSGKAGSLQITSGTNALNVAIILGIMALPTIVSVSEDALQAVGRELRDGAYALGMTRAEMLLHVVLPAAASGICAAIILGVMRAVGETMVVWMASGNAAQIPKPWYNILEPVRTLTATIAGEMGEADQVTGSARFHVLFAMALCLLTVSYVFNLVSEAVVRRNRRKLGV